MKKALIAILGAVLCATVVVAGLDTTGLTYTTLASDVTTAGAGPIYYGGYVNISALKGNAQIVLSDVLITGTTGTVTWAVLTGATTNACTNAVSTIALTAGTTNASTVVNDSFNTEDLSVYARLIGTSQVTTTVRRASAVIVSY